MERNENGYSTPAPRGISDAERRRNGSCPGTGDLWRGEGGNAQMDDGDLLNDISWQNVRAAHNACSKHQLAMVYSPHQCWRMLYAPEKALMRGTLFEELDKPLEDCVNG